MTVPAAPWHYQTIPHRARTKLAGTDLEVEVRQVAVVGDWNHNSYRACRVRYATARWTEGGQDWAWFQVQVGERGPVVSRTWRVGEGEPCVREPAESGDRRVRVWRVVDR